MAGTLTHSPAKVVRQLLIDLGLCSTPASGSPWPAFHGKEPGEPDDVVTAYNTAPRAGGREQFSGRREEKHGIQIRVRSKTQDLGFAKCRAVSVALDEDVYDKVVTVDATSYTVHAFYRTTDVVELGTEVPKSQRFLYTVNFVLDVEENPLTD